MASRRRPDWPKVALALANAIPRTRLHPRVLAWVAARKRHRRWAVGFSGGSDSVALLLLVWAHWPERRERLMALHFDHRLRGAASAADARFCASVCRGLDIPLRTGRWTGRRPKEGISEADAREARHAFFADELRRARSDTLWLGHQQDDVAETLLMRLARGSGPGGLSAPRPVQAFRGRVLLRPLLGLKRRALVEALEASGATWREDASNQRADYFRNRVRQKVLPAWVEAAGRDAVAGAALSRDRLEEDDAALECWLDELAPIDRDGVLWLDRLEGRPAALWRRALHRWLLAHPTAGELSRHGFEELLSKLRAGNATRFSLGRAAFAKISGRQLRFERNTAKPNRRSTVLQGSSR